MTIHVRLVMISHVSTFQHWMGSTMAEALSDLEEARKENASLKDKAAKIQHDKTHADSAGRFLTGA